MSFIIESYSKRIEAEKIAIVYYKRESNFIMINRSIRWRIVSVTQPRNFEFKQRSNLLPTSQISNR